MFHIYFPTWKVLNAILTCNEREGFHEFFGKFAVDTGDEIFGADTLVGGFIDRVKKEFTRVFGFSVVHVKRQYTLLQ
jgi:hypothetical protein